MFIIPSVDGYVIQTYTIEYTVPGSLDGSTLGPAITAPSKQSDPQQLYRPPVPDNLGLIDVDYVVSATGSDRVGTRGNRFIPWIWIESPVAGTIGGSKLEVVDAVDGSVSVQEEIADLSGLTTFYKKDGILMPQGSLLRISGFTNPGPETIKVRLHVQYLTDAGLLLVQRLLCCDGGLTVEDDGTEIIENAETMNFVGSGVSVAVSGPNKVDVTIPGAPSVEEANQYQRKQTQTSLTSIAAKSLATPTGFWDFDRALTERVTGGVGRDFVMPGVSGNADAYSLIEGVPGASDQVYGLFLDSASMAEVNNAAVWRARSDETDLSVGVWVRVADYSSTGTTQEQGLLGYVNRSSATIAASTAPTYILFFDPIAGGTYFRIRWGYWDNTTAFVGVTWETVGTTRPIRVDAQQWVHIGGRRIRNGVDDVELFLHVNGEIVASVSGLNDTGDPDSSNMRMIAGARMASADEFFGTMRDLVFFRGDYGDAGMRSLYQIGVGE